MLAVALMAGASPVFAQVPQEIPPSQDPEATQLEEVVVPATPLQQMARNFVSSVASPARGRTPASWRERICVGVGGMRPAAAQALADRVSDWGQSLGLSSGDPGCTPNIFIVATDDGDATARELVASRPREFHTGAGGTDAGRGSLEAFQTSGKLVRWWHVSLPVNADTGAPVVRLPGQSPFGGGVITTPADLGAFGNSTGPSRIADGTRDDLMQVIIVLDAAALDQASFSQIADYIAMVAFAQIEPDASPSAPSILHLFDAGRPQEDTLSRWDQAYLQALYANRDGSSGGSLSRLADGMETELLSEPPAISDEAP